MKALTNILEFILILGVAATLVLFLLPRDEPELQAPTAGNQTIETESRELADGEERILSSSEIARRFRTESQQVVEAPIIEEAAPPPIEVTRDLIPFGSSMINGVPVLLFRERSTGEIIDLSIGATSGGWTLLEWGDDEILVEREGVVYRVEGGN